MMECPHCQTEMELEAYDYEYANNEEIYILRDEFWCPGCDTRITRWTHYKKFKEEMKEV